MSTNNLLLTLVILVLLLIAHWVFEYRAIQKKELEELKKDEHEDYFNYDLDRMKEIMEQEGERMPKIDNLEELEDWLDRKE